jgi:murein DD-endopeptidase MepM/ murein hydrolase activator NlpD
MVTMGPTVRAEARPARRWIAILTAVVCAVSVASTSAEAVPTSSDPGKDKRRVDAQVEQLRAQLDETSADLSAAYTALRSTQDKLPAARTVLEKAQNAAATADRANAVAAQELEAARASEKKAEDKLASTTKEVRSSRTRVAQFAAQIYQEQGFGQLDMALSSSDPQQFADRIALVDTVMDVQGETMDRLATERASLTALEDHLSALRADSADKKKKAQAALERAQSARDAASRAKADLDALAAQQATLASSVEAKLATENERLASMEAEQARLHKVLVQRAAEQRRRAEARRRAAVAAAAAASAAAAAAAKKQRSSAAASKRRAGAGGGGGGSAAPRSNAFLGDPVDGPTTSEFGMRFHPIKHIWKLHTGRDFGVPCGTPVRAAAAGEIISAGWGGGYGNRIVIDHGLVRGVGLASTYNHLTRLVRSGGHVSRGQLIGYSGTTGTSTGCHLHFEVLEDGNFVNPRTWM